MKLKTLALGLLFITLLLSCKNDKEASNPENSELNTTDTSQEFGSELSKIDRDAIIRDLQGNWKESQYPFRLAQFRDSVVKFIEEGVVEEPKFQEYQISKECPFEVNNIKNVEPDDIILVMVEAGTCEKLQISKNTLTLSGFNAHTESDYRIVYERVE